MGKWIYTLTAYHDFSEKYDEGECQISDIAKAVVDEIKQKLSRQLKTDEWLQEIVTGFEELTEWGEDATEDAFNYELNSLYDWADTHFTWIEPNF